MKEIDENAREKKHQHFEVLDDDKDGAIDFDEFTDRLKIVGVSKFPAKAHEQFAKVDTNCDERLSFDEFIAWWQTGWYKD